jgi:hypothetical protein
LKSNEVNSIIEAQKNELTLTKLLTVPDNPIGGANLSLPAIDRAEEVKNVTHQR